MLTPRSRVIVSIPGTDDRMATVIGITGVHPVYGDPVTVSVRTDAGDTLPPVHVDNLTEQPTIVTNYVPRDVVDASELTASERETFDYVDWDAIERGEDSASFFRYRGETYDLGDFQRTSDLGFSSDFRQWDGVASDSFFSGVLVRYADESCETVIVARYYS